MKGMFNFFTFSLFSADSIPWPCSAREGGGHYSPREAGLQSWLFQHSASREASLYSAQDTAVNKAHETMVVVYSIILWITL